MRNLRHATLRVVTAGRRSTRWSPGLPRPGADRWRLALIDRLAVLLARTPAGLLAVVCYLCRGLIAPEFAGVDLGLAGKLAVRAVATVTGTGSEQVAAGVRETGDLGRAAGQMLAVTAAGRAAGLGVTVVVGSLHRIAGSSAPEADHTGLVQPHSVTGLAAACSSNSRTAAGLACRC